MAANGDSQTVSEYIVHHLTNLTYGKLPGGYERYGSHHGLPKAVGPPHRCRRNQRYDGLHKGHRQSENEGKMRPLSDH